MYFKKTKHTIACPLHSVKLYKILPYGIQVNHRSLCPVVLSYSLTTMCEIRKLTETVVLHFNCNLAVPCTDNIFSIGASNHIPLIVIALLCKPFTPMFGGCLVTTVCASSGCR
jgi:hypothetical protein